MGKLVEDKSYFGKVGLYRLVLVSNFYLLHGHEPSLGNSMYGSPHFSEMSAFRQIRKF